MRTLEGLAQMCAVSCDAVWLQLALVKARAHVCACARVRVRACRTSDSSIEEGGGGAGGRSIESEEGARSPVCEVSRVVMATTSPSWRTWLRSAIRPFTWWGKWVGGRAGGWMGGW